MKLPASIESVVQLMQKVPGVGRRTAERYAFDFALTWQKNDLTKFQEALEKLKESLSLCPECGALCEMHICPFCANMSRKKEVLVVVASAKDIFAIEKTGEYRGLYHVLGATLSPLDGRGEEKLQMAKLGNRIQALGVQELILALDSTLEGDTTALYIRDTFEKTPLKIFRLAFGIPVGSSIDYVDGGTLARSFSGRLPF